MKDLLSLGVFSLPPSTSIFLARRTGEFLRTSQKRFRIVLAIPPTQWVWYRLISTATCLTSRNDGAVGPFDQLTAGPQSIDIDAHEWWVAHVLSRQEKCLARDCDRLGIVYFLPLARRNRKPRGAGKVETVYEPLFPGWLLIAPATDDQIYGVKGTWRLCGSHGLQRVEQQEKFRGEMKIVIDALAADPYLTATKELRLGDPVYVAHGPWKGRYARFQSLYGSDKCWLLLTTMCRLVEVGVCRDFVERITEQEYIEATR